MKVNLAFLHGFGAYNEDGTRVSTPLAITGDENSITLTKGEGLDAWLADTTKIIVEEGETTVSAENLRRLAIMIGQWLRGEEMDA